MKKSICILVVAILVLATTCGLCDDDSSAIPFTAGFTSSVAPDSALEIITDETQRAILTVSLALDFAICEDGEDYMANNFAKFILNDSYVASDGTFLVVTGYAGGKCLNMFYYPKTKEASYYMTDIDMSDELMDILVKTVAEKLPLSYKNEAADLLQVIDVIKEATGN